MAFLEAVLIFVVGFLAGAITRWVATLAAVVALLLALLGLAAPPSFFRAIDPVLAVYAGNELLFLSGFLFAIGASEAAE